MNKIIANASRISGQGSSGITSTEVLAQFRAIRSVKEFDRLLLKYSFDQDALPYDIVNNGIEAIKEFFITLGLTLASNPKISRTFHKHFNEERHIDPLTKISEQERKDTARAYPHNKHMAALDFVYHTGRLPSGESFYVWLEHVHTQREMRGLLQLIYFWDENHGPSLEKLPYDISYDQALFLGFMVKIHKLMAGTPKWEWFLSELDHEKHILPFRKRWFQTFRICKLDQHLPGLEIRVLRDGWFRKLLPLRMLRVIDDPWRYTQRWYFARLKVRNYMRSLFRGS